MATTTFYLAKLVFDVETGTEHIRAINREDNPFDLVELFTAMRDLYDQEAANARPDDGVVLQIKRKPWIGKATDHIFAFGYREVAELLEEYSKDAWGGYAANPKPFVSTLEKRFGPIDEDLERSD